LSEYPHDSSLNAIKHKPPTAFNSGNVPKSSSKAIIGGFASYYPN